MVAELLVPLAGGVCLDKEASFRPRAAPSGVYQKNKRQGDGREGGGAPEGALRQHLGHDAVAQRLAALGPGGGAVRRHQGGRLRHGE